MSIGKFVPKFALFPALPAELKAQILDPVLPTLRDEYIKPTSKKSAQETIDQAEVVKYFTRHSLDIDKAPPYKPPIPTQALLARKPWLFDMSLKHTNIVDQRDSIGTTPLLVAITTNHSVQAKKLLARGANPHIKDYTGKDSFETAAQYGQTELLDFLLKKHGSKLEKTKKKYLTKTAQQQKQRIEDAKKINPRDRDQALVDALSHDQTRTQVEKSRRIFDGLNPERRTQWLQQKLTKQKENHAIALIRAGANVNQKAGFPISKATLNQSDSTMLTRSAELNNSPVVNALLSHRVDVNEGELQQGFGVLHSIASHPEKLPITKAIMNAGVNIEKKGGAQKHTALHRAAMEGNAATVEEMLNRGADINTKEDNSGWTLLHAAVISDSPVIAKDLIHRGIDVNATDDLGRTAYDLAEAWNKPHVLKALESKINNP